jgi:serine-type D-Ala-D-Ala carboxypeptidase/endopeptidase (penicillin-binding protein 4)
MRLFRALILFTVALPLPAIAQASPTVQAPENLQLTQASPGSNLCPAQLNGAINTVVNRVPFRRSRWGILVQTLATQGKYTTLYDRDGQHYFTPASNTKLLTTAAALTQLKSQYRIRTSIHRVAATNNQTVLRVVGRGDPSLTPKELQSLAQQLSQKGIKRIDRLIGDDSYFGGAIVNPNWEWGDLQAGYGATVNSLIVNQNAIGLTLFPQTLGQPLRVQWDDPTEAAGWQVANTSRTVDAQAPEFLEVGRDFSKPILQIKGQLRVGAESETVTVAVADPAQHFLQHLRRALIAQQIPVGQTLVTTTASSIPEPEIAFVQSPPLATLLAETNQESNNLYAEALLRSLSKIPPTNTANPGLETGLANLKTTLSRLGVDASGYSLVDGSGLSRLNLISPTALVQTLQAMATAPEAKIYRASLAVGGESGTLRNRFRNTPAQGNLQAKTGTLTGAIALSGYVNPPGYQPLVFSILVNQSTEPTPSLRSAIDEIVLLLTQLKSC